MLLRSEVSTTETGSAAGEHFRSLLKASHSARRVDQCPDSLTLRQLVVPPSRLLGLQNFDGDLPTLQHLERLGADLQALVHPPRENHHCRTVLQEFRDVSWLDAR